ncbi:hypothetical protein TNCT_295961 [Trichonephila clavata]|uniref:Uncharacterized protein n=1 Tax=Trichonephila clavata TaxID=2740835 RepID=A0A8X6HZ72_TRICU|nr:hypothetical protein TNCT_295961 [Trichonephila clavata]
MTTLHIFSEIHFNLCPKNHRPKRQTSKNPKAYHLYPLHLKHEVQNGHHSSSFFLRLKVNCEESAFSLKIHLTPFHRRAKWLYVLVHREFYFMVCFETFHNDKRLEKSLV